MEPQSNTAFSSLDEVKSFEPFIVTPLDHMVPPFHLFAHFTFTLDSPSAAIPVLQNGLSRLLDALPFLGGDIHVLDEFQGRRNVIQIRPTDAASLLDSPILRITHHNATTADVAGDAVNHADYAPIPLEMMCPDPSPVTRFQANIMQDGVVFTIVFDHRGMDGLGVVALVDALAACCRGDAAPTSMALQVQKKQQITAAASATPFRNNDAFGSEPRIVPDTISRLFTLSAVKINQLKTICNSLQRSGQPNPTLSNNDIIAAIIWIAVTRARHQLSPSTRHDAPATFGSIVEIRSAFKPKLGNYIGNALLPARCSFSHHAMTRKNADPLADLSLIHDVALLHRNEVLSITPDHAHSFISHIKSLDDWGSFQGQMPDMALSNLRNFPLYKIDFGSVLGRLSNIDLPDRRVNGFAWIMPAKPPVAGAKQSSWELRVVLEEPVMESLEREPLFCWASDTSSTIGSSKL